MQPAHESAYDAMLAAVERRDRLDAAIAVMAADSEHTPVVTRLGYLRGVSTLITFGLVVETGDWQRLTNRSIGAYLGLVPTEHSSGGTRSQGSITKTGNPDRRLSSALARFSVVRAGPVRLPRAGPRNA